jgi:hypothetical protein
MAERGRKYKTLLGLVDAYNYPARELGPLK